MSNPYTLDNNAERQHLVALANRLTEDELRHPLEAGWTVAGVLAHLAFWDQRALLLLRKWRQEGIGPSPIDTDPVNEATRGFLVALPPCRAAQLAIAAAEALDQEIEQLSAEFLAEVEAKGKTVRLDRAHHRRGHLGQIEQALGIS